MALSSDDVASSNNCPNAPYSVKLSRTSVSSQHYQQSLRNKNCTLTAIQQGTCQDCRILQYCPCESNTLQLATTEPQATFSNQGIITFREVADNGIVDCRCLQIPKKFRRSPNSNANAQWGGGGGGGLSLFWGPYRRSQSLKSSSICLKMRREMRPQHSKFEAATASWNKALPTTGVGLK